MGLRTIKRTLGTIPIDSEMLRLMDNEDMDMDNTIVEYNSNDVFGDLN
jgi:hypothetical protein